MNIKMNKLIGFHIIQLSLPNHTSDDEMSSEWLSVKSFIVVKVKTKCKTLTEMTAIL